MLRFASHSTRCVPACMFAGIFGAAPKTLSIYVDFKDLFSAAKELANEAFDGIKSIF